MMDMLRSAWVIGRRDFAAIIFSKAFFFFLIGPAIPVVVGIAAGSVGSQVARDIDQPTIGIAMQAEDARRMARARERLVEQLGERRMPEVQPVDPTLSETQLEALLQEGGADGAKYIAILAGRLDDPLLIGTDADIERWQGEVALLVEYARQDLGGGKVEIGSRAIADSEGAREQGRLVTAQAGQFVLVLLTMLLAGMVLSNLVEEKTNKIIEILAAAIPIDAIFLGKLVAMLAMAIIGILVWAIAGVTVVQLATGSLPSLPTPAVGWPLFMLLGITYFSMAYLLLGSIFLGIGAMATTVREVQTLSMPATMGQLIVFFLAAYSVTRLGEPIELFAAVFPFSSPFAMLARAAQQDMLWPHLLAIVWQLAWVIVFVRIGARIFRRNVMKSGQARRGKRSLWQRLRGVPSSQ